jgi:hypothetical protein
MKKSIATIILNRNLPAETDRLYERLSKHSGDVSDIYVVESGSLKSNLSKNHTWWENSIEGTKFGLRYPRGFNYGLKKLIEEGLYENYEYIFFLCNDVTFQDYSVLHILLDEISKHSKLGIISATSSRWGENQLIPKNGTKYFWNIQLLSALVRTNFIDSIKSDVLDEKCLFFDGTNFRGYLSDSEVILKGYANDWASAITSRVYQMEDDSQLKTKSDLMRTDSFEVNHEKSINEGLSWLKSKYGYDGSKRFYQASRFFYEQFFKYYPELMEHKI